MPLAFFTLSSRFLRLTRLTTLDRYFHPPARDHGVGGVHREQEHGHKPVLGRQAHGPAQPSTAAEEAGEGCAEGCREGCEGGELRGVGAQLLPREGSARVGRLHLQRHQGAHGGMYFRRTPQECVSTHTQSKEYTQYTQYTQYMSGSVGCPPRLYVSSPRAERGTASGGWRGEGASGRAAWRRRGG
eukprot:1183946-Prorocentrum_minimum.AAC.4